MKYLVILLILLTGCQYHTEIFIDGEKKAELISNVKSKAKIQDVEIDQRSEAWWEKMFPKNVEIDK
jgi:uncharacterized protein YcfL